MKLERNEQEAVHNLGATINRAIEKSFDVSRAIEDLRALGFEPHLTLKLEIALQKLGDNQESDDIFDDEDFDENDFDGEPQTDVELELTDEDLKTLRRMKIRFE